ncbi:MAG: L-asparaginase/archaeal Glu-tRNAGln amidotransferase subunit D AnsB [Candidatus Methanohalarchaeum thermophilum]|uniref:Glutamyl-tRNA(Gln) amidotransferase subunit D n=1 Tax=Methanohalarchaeum thermophilum TaxID=1903181 RepID=A0A1Q6DXQ4_METT1|nr:MAG: L-asparaginase/archaeal Glu-tRNAGln amidotransferase subunit D AnsB [Candidatus Methanohalarchaeum thermophilum]
MDVDDFLKEKELETGDYIKIEKDSKLIEGRVMPSSKGNKLVLKLNNGYNIGIELEEIKLKEKISSSEEKQKKEIEIEENEDLPLISVLSTGGTIASSVDYRTGAVTSQFDADDILANIPELSKYANFRGKVVCNILSENMEPKYWKEIANSVYKEIKKGVDGVIIAHGTDTMAYTASALSFMLETPVPIALVGSQRSADRPSSDNVLNAISAAKYASSNIAETAIVMHAESSDNYCYAHRGTKARKMHTSRRDAFRSINKNPIAKIDDEVQLLDEDVNKRDEKSLKLKDGLNTNCGLLKFTPGLDEEILDKYCETFDGIVLEGTGLGHVSRSWISKIKEANKEGIPIVMTSQCLYGRVCDRVYDTGRDLLEAGVIEGEDMLPETALIKLMWVMNRTEDLEKIKELMQENLAGEITNRTKKQTYLI